MAAELKTEDEKRWAQDLGRSPYFNHGCWRQAAELADIVGKQVQNMIDTAPRRQVSSAEAADAG